MDWHQLWTIVSAPDNVPIVAMLFLVPFFTWLGFKQAIANDQLDRAAWKPIRNSPRRIIARR